MRICRLRFVHGLPAVLALLALTPTRATTAPALLVEEENGIHRIWAQTVGPDGQVGVFFLRETASPVTPGPAGGDPDGRALFTTWSEGGTDRWFSYSQDRGRSWSEPRPISMELRLHDGATAPGSPVPAVEPRLVLPASGRLYLVQFRTIGLPEWRRALEEAGVEVLSFFPMNAHIVRMPPALVRGIAALEFVERVEPYHPAYRIERELRSWAVGPDDLAEPRELRVRAMAFAWGPQGKARIREAAEAAGARVAQDDPSGHILELWVSRPQLRAIAAHDELMWIDRWSPPEDDMDLVREDSGANYIESGFGTCGQGVRGEVMDSGIESTHMDFDGILMHTSADVQSHGTSTYGIVFGNGNRDGDGNAQGTGHLPGCSGTQGIFADYGVVTNRFAHTQELKGSPYFASFQTNSWGDAQTTAYTSVSHQMDDIIWRLDIAITQSQSNTGNQNSRPQAWAKNIISVGGIRHYNTLSTSDDAWAGGASIGPAADGRIKPDLNYWYDSIYTTTTGNGYTSSFGGTSAATPEVAGVLGLVVQMWSENAWGTNPQGTTVFERQPRFGTIKALLVNNAQQYPFSGTTHDLTRTHQGWGRPSARLARDRAARSFVVDQSQPLVLSQAAVYDVTVDSGEPELKVTMVYPDPPGTTSSTLHRINDVNLKVTSPSGTIYHGNSGLNAGTTSTSGGSPNTVDTVENVFVASPQAGTWTVEVKAVEVNQDAHLDTPAADVTFALVVTGAVSQPAVCGNGVQEGAEQCDGGDLNGESCQTQGYNSGTLSCNPDCTFNTSGCSNLCKPAGQSCTSHSECCSLNCRGKPGRKTCK
jgi:hypothetical protein